MELKFGKHKGKDLRDVPTEYILYLADGMDVNDPKYGAKNQLLVEACHQEINRRTDASMGRQTKAPRSAPERPLPVIQLQPKTKNDVVKGIQALIDDLYKHAVEMQKMVDDYDQDGNVTTRNSEYLPF